MTALLRWFSRRPAFADGEIELVLSNETVADREIGILDGYVFKIYLVGQRDYAGYVSLRLGESAALYYLGHIGYRIEPNFRGRGYAARGCELMLPLIRKLGIKSLVITNDVDNLPSRRTCERLGCELERIAPVPPEYRAVCSGSTRKCRYIWRIPDGVGPIGEWHILAGEADVLYLTANGVRVYYEQAGESGGQVLLLHGWGCSTTHFKPIMEVLRKDHRVAVIDFPAHGQSDKPNAPWAVGDFADCVTDVMRQLDLAPTDIIAHSFGGRVALTIAASAPERVNRLVLTGCAGLKAPQTEAQKRRSAAYKRGKTACEALMKCKPFAPIGERLLDSLRKKYGSADYNALDADMRATFSKVVSEDLRPLLPNIKAPTLLIWGEKDAETPLWMGQTMEKEIADAGLVVFEGDDHFAYLKQWQRFATIVESFLKEG